MVKPTAAATPPRAIALVNHDQPFVAKVLYEDPSGRWAYAQVFQIRDGVPVNVTPSIASHLASLGSSGQFAGNLRDPEHLRLIATASTNQPAMLIHALTMHLSRCAHAMGQSFKALVLDDAVDTTWTTTQQARLNAAMNTASHRASHPRLTHAPVDHGRPFLYRVVHELQEGRVAHVQVLQDRRDQRVDVTSALADHLLSLDAVGQVAGSFAAREGVFIVAEAAPNRAGNDPLRFENSLRHTLGRCANAMGARLQTLQRDDTARSGPLPAALHDEAQALQSEAQAPRVTARRPAA